MCQWCVNKDTQERVYTLVRESRAWTSIYNTGSALLGCHSSRDGGHVTRRCRRLAKSRKNTLLVEKQVHTGGREHSHEGSLHLACGSMAGAQSHRWDRVASSSWDRRGQGTWEILTQLWDWGYESTGCGQGSYRSSLFLTGPEYKRQNKS